MRTQIRLAERQGLLIGKGLSWLQVAALYYRQVEDDIEQHEQRKEQFKYALMSDSGHIPLGELFPELAQIQAERDDNADLADDEESVTYRFEEQSMTPEQMEQELAALMAGGSMTVNGGEIE